MATVLENLQTRRAAVAEEIAALDSTKAGGLPDTKDGRIRHQAYKEGLYKELERLDGLIAAEAAQDVYEIHSRAVSS